MNRIKTVFFCVVLLAVGIFVTFAGVKEYRNSKRIKKEGQETVGKVVDSEERRGRRGRRSYYLTVEFQTASQQTVEKELKVSRSVYTQATDTGSVKVHYVPSEPKICAFGEKVEATFGTTIWGVIALIGSVVLFRGAFGSGDDGESVAATSNGTQVAQSGQSNSVDSSSSDVDDFEEAA